MKNKNNYYTHSKLLPLHKISLQIVIPEERNLYFPIFFITLRLKRSRYCINKRLFNATEK